MKELWTSLGSNPSGSLLFLWPCSTDSPSQDGLHRRLFEGQCSNISKESVAKQWSVVMSSLRILLYSQSFVLWPYPNPQTLIFWDVIHLAFKQALMSTHWCWNVEGGENVETREGLMKHVQTLELLVGEGTEKLRAEESGCPLNMTAPLCTGTHSGYGCIHVTCIRSS